MLITTLTPGSGASAHNAVTDSGPDIIHDLIHQLDSKDGMVRQQARERLVGIGRPAAGALLALLPGPNERLAWEAAKTLDLIGDPCTATGFVDALEDPRGGISWLAGEGLIRLGRDALEPLLKALTYRSDSPWLLRGAHHVLRELSDYVPSEVLQPVIKALDEPEANLGVRVAAYNALRALTVAGQRIAQPPCAS